MISIDIRHPDVEKFITIKQDLTKITGANISIQLRDDFMKAVKNNTEYVLRFPCNETPEKASFTKTVNAREVWNKIIEAAHKSAEPGLMFLDKHWDYSPDSVYPQYKGVTTNPCGEIFMQPYDACRLLATNLFSFVDNPFTEKATFNFEKFYEIAYEQQRLADDLVDLELSHIDRILSKLENDPEPSEVKSREIELWRKIRQTAESSRRTGSGFTALGDTLAALGISYDSDDALDVTELIMRTKFKAELDCTIDLAILRGCFKGFDGNREFDVAGDDINGYAMTSGHNAFFQNLLENFPKEAYKMYWFGRRNANWSTVAPTGSVSILTQTTSGLEPLFSWGYMRRKKVNPGDEGVRVDFTDQNGDNWMEYPVLHPKFKDWLRCVHFSPHEDDREPFEKWLVENKNEIENYFKQSPWYGSTANDINWTRRVELQGIIQKYTTHSISTTLNLPNDVSLEEVSDIYMRSWEMNLKGQTIYRDGSRSGVLVSMDAPKDAEAFETHDAPKRPKELPCDIHHVKSKGTDYTVLVGLFDQKPYEVFIIPAKIAHGYENGTLTKMKSATYNLTYSLDEQTMIIRDITENMTDEQEAITRLVSTSLRHGTNIKFIVEQLQKIEGDLNSFVRVLARVLKTYIPDGETSTLKCNDCGGTNVIFQEGCATCKDCGSSRCG